MKFYIRFWKNPEYLTNFWASDYWSCTDGTRVFILSPTALPFGILAITLCSKLRFGRSCTCWKSYEILYKILKKFWAFKHFLNVVWTYDSVGSSGASHFCANPKKHRMNRRNHPMVPPNHPVLIHLFSSSQEFIRCSQKWDRRIILCPIFSTS
jgi:hypothetical protein